MATKKAISHSRRSEPVRTKVRPSHGLSQGVGDIKPPAWPRGAIAQRPSRKVSHGPGPVLVGTASWADPGFVADWYPPDLSANERLPWYAEHFNLVEVNSSFYAIPSPVAAERWVEQTPDDFVFDVKLHRLLSRHSTPVKMLPPKLRQLAGNEEKAAWSPKLEAAMARRFLEAIQPLKEGGKLGALLLQFSPSFRPRTNPLEELEHLLELLHGHNLAVEFRNRDWLAEGHLDETLKFFAQRQVALVSVDAPKTEHFMAMPNDDYVTSPKLAYLRAHGRNVHGYVRGRTVAERFDYDYSDKELKEIAGRVKALSQLASQTHVIFNNNKSNYAPKAATRFREIQEKMFPETAVKGGR